MIKGWLTLLFLLSVSYTLPYDLPSPPNSSLQNTSEKARTLSSKKEVYPSEEWEQREPEEVGLSRSALEALREWVGGDGCVVRYGYLVYSWGNPSRSADVASACKPVISTFLLFALQEGRIKSPDDQVSDFEPRLRTLNGGKDGGITWRHLASQTSGYGLIEPPGKAYAYNDYAIALYYDVLTQKVFKEEGTQLLKKYLADPLQFQDPYTFNAFGPQDRPGRLAISVRDFARFGLLYLRQGRWKKRQLIKPELLLLTLNHPVPTDTPRSSGQEAEMLPGQRSLGGGKNQTALGPGLYSFNWWLNRRDKRGRRLWPDAPPDTYAAIGHAGMRMLWVFPAWDLIVAWNNARIEGSDNDIGNPNSPLNRAVRLLREAIKAHPPPTSSPRTVLGIQGTRFLINGKPTFLLGISYYGALGAPRATLLKDLEQMKRYGFNWIRVWATWEAFGNNVSAVDERGEERPPYLEKLKELLAESDRRHMVVDVTLSRGGGSPLRLLSSHRRAVETLVSALKPYRNWYLDLANERNIRDSRFVSIEELKELRETVKRLDPHRLVTASHGGDLSEEDLKDYLLNVQLDFLSPHRPRHPESPRQTLAQTKTYLSQMRKLGRLVPLHYQEPFRRGYSPQNWEPPASAFLTDLKQAQEGGAGGWCFHNGDQKNHPEGKPRRSFDLREKSLFEQLDEEERKFLNSLRSLPR